LDCSCTRSTGPEVGFGLNTDLRSLWSDREILDDFLVAEDGGSGNGGGGAARRSGKCGMDRVLEDMAESSWRLNELSSNESYSVLPQSHTRDLGLSCWISLCF
jgi:hypothetical protein